MANTTPIVTTVTKTATKEKTPKETDAAPRVNILDFCEGHYEDILPVIMDKIHRDKRKEVHTRLDFGDNTKRSRRIREGSQNSSTGTLSARYRNPSERPKVRDRLKDNDGNVFGRLALGIIPTIEVTLTDGTLLSAGIVLKVETAPVASNNHKRKGNSPLSRVSESGTSDGGHWKSKSKRHKPTDEDDLAVPCTGGMLGNAYMVSYVQFYLNRDRESVVPNYLGEQTQGGSSAKHRGYPCLQRFLAFMPKEVHKDPVEIHDTTRRMESPSRHFMKWFQVRLAHEGARVHPTLGFMMGLTTLS
ncbi:hypothetical protein Tco_0849450 [Tanacetum coccineum]